MSKIEKNNLGYLGEDFQYRLVNAFISDQGFFRDLNSVIDQNMFTNQYLRTIVGVMKDFFEKNEFTPSYDMIQIKLNERATSSEDSEYYTEVLNKIRKSPTDGYKEVEDMAERFFFQQNLIKVSNELKLMASGGDISKYNECRKLLEGALSVGRKNNNISSPFDFLDEDLSPEAITTIPLGVERLDEALNGGLDKGKLGLIICPMGAGKALPDNELVCTPNGFTEIKNIRVGDYVIGSNGKPTMVTGVFPQGERGIYSVNFTDGVSCRCDKEHLWTVKTSTNDIITKTLDELMDSDIKDSNGYKYSLDLCKPVEYIDKETEINPYLFALILSNSYSKNGVISIKKSRENKIISNLIKLNLDFSKVEKKKFTELKFNIDDNILSNKTIHENYMYNSVKNRTLLLNGFMDASGYCNNNGKCYFLTRSKQLSYDVKQLVLSLGGLSKIMKSKVTYFDKNEQKKKTIIYYKVSVLLFDKNLPIFTLDKYQKRVIYGDDKVKYRYIKSAKYLYQQNAICIKVDAEDELFLTRNYIVTHNTSFTTCIAANAARSKTKDNDYNGYKVIQFCFEDKPRDLRKKYAANVSGIESKKFNKPVENGVDIEAVKEMLRNSEDFELLHNNIKIVKLNTGEVTATDIKNMIKKEANKGFKADMVIVDYFECVEPENGYSKEDVTTREGKTMRKFETMAEELDIALWIPTQGNRESISTDLVTNDKVGGSIRKNQIAQVVLSITRSVDDIKNKLATLAILKNRTGEAGITLNGVYFDNGTCTIKTDNVVEFDDVLGYNEYAEEIENERTKNMIKEARNSIKK